MRKFWIVVLCPIILLSACFKTRDDQPAAEKKDKIFLMGTAMYRLNWTNVEGNDIRFRYSDLGLPADFSTRERASLMVDGTFGDGAYSIDGFLNYDPENRITEPPLEFLLKVGNDQMYAAVGDYRLGLFPDSVFARYQHPFRGVVLGTRGKYFGAEIIGGRARGETGIEELPGDSGVGPYYLGESPILRGSEMVYLVVKSAGNPDLEIKRIPMVRNQDYYMDYDRGAIIFNSPLYPIDELGNPVYILTTYQFESIVGRFTRAVFGLNAYAAPWKFLKLNFTYLADADGSLSLEDAIDQRRGIYSFGLNVDSKIVKFFGEFAFSREPGFDNQNGLFGGGSINISKKLHVYFNSWSIDREFPTFANKQMEYGYGLMQIFPSYAERSIFLSPFQFTRNLGAELYPFSLARLTLDEKEAHGFVEYKDDTNTFSAGYGTEEEILTELVSRTLYASGFHDGNTTKAWGKFQLTNKYDQSKTQVDNRSHEFLLGVRQRAWKGQKGELFVQADYSGQKMDDFLELAPNTYRSTASIFTEYLTSGEGVFAGYRKERLTNRDLDEVQIENNIYELGVRSHIYKGFFLDSRFRHEEGSGSAGESRNQILSVGGGIETAKFRAMARYEIQTNKRDQDEGRRHLWSLSLFGTPLKGLNFNLRYYRQLGKEEVPFSLNERSEEQLSARILWRANRVLSLYSQWRYDTNIELYPPLDRTKSNSLASVQGLKLRLNKKLEFLANYKLLKIWGPIENRKQSAAAEMGYLLFKNLRVGIGAEIIDFEDPFNQDLNYHSTVGYLKLMGLF